MQTKICCRCKRKKSLKDFHKNKAKSDGHTCECGSCLCKRAQQYRKLYPKQVAKYKKQHRKKLRKQGRKYWRVHRKEYQEYWFQHNYNLSLKQRKQIYVDQNGCCAICNISIPLNKIAVDHDHKIDKVRGLLCINCNTRLSVIEDKEFVKKAKKYLRNNSQ